MGDYLPDLSVAAQGPIANCCEHGNEYLGSIKGGEFNDCALAS
jgi:hypothetical protein